MSLPAILASEFTGVLKVSSNEFTLEKIQEYIDDLYPDLVRELVGDSVLCAVVNDPDKDNVTTNEKWLALFEGYDYVNDDNEMLTFVGIKSVIKDMIYFHFQRDDFLATIAGNVKSIQENSTSLTRGQNNGRARLRYNRAVRNLNNSLLPFLDKYMEVENDVSGITNVGDVYTVNVDSTEFLTVGDTVAIGNEKYTVDAIITDTSFDVTSTTAVSGETATWEPYKLVKACYNYNYIVF